MAVSGAVTITCGETNGDDGTCDNLRLNVNREVPVAAGSLVMVCGRRACHFVRLNLNVKGDTRLDCHSYHGNDDWGGACGWMSLYLNAPGCAGI